MADALLGKLRALEAQMRDCSSWDRGTAQTDLAGLLPEIVAALQTLTNERDEAQRDYIACVQRYTAIGG